MTFLTKNPNVILLLIMACPSPNSPLSPPFFFDQFFVGALRDVNDNVVNFVGIQCQVQEHTQPLNTPSQHTFSIHILSTHPSNTP